VYLLGFHTYINEMHGSKSKTPSKKSRPYIYDVKFLAVLGALYIYDISRLRVKLRRESSQIYVNPACSSQFDAATDTTPFRPHQRLCQTEPHSESSVSSRTAWALQLRATGHSETSDCTYRVTTPHVPQDSSQ
jgi:hypothetical protein